MGLTIVLTIRMDGWMDGGWMDGWMDEMETSMYCAFVKSYWCTGSSIRI